MAKKTKGGSANKAKATEESVSDTAKDAIEEAISETSEDAAAAVEDVSETRETATDAVEDAVSSTESDVPASEGEGAPEAPSDETVTDAAAPSDGDPIPVVPPPVEPAQKSGGGTAMGGVIAAAIGAGALFLVQQFGWLNLGGPDPELVARIDALETELSAAQEAVASADAEIIALKEAEPDLSPLTSAIEAVQSSSEEGLSALTETASGNSEALTALVERLEGTDTLLAGTVERLNNTDERLESVAVQQIPEAELPKAISDAYDAKLADLLASIDGRFETMQGSVSEEFETMQGTMSGTFETMQGTMTERFAEMETTFTAKLTDIEAAEAKAAEAEAEAEQAARTAVALEGLAALQTALETGNPFGDALVRIQENSDATVSDALTSVADTGVATVATLAAEFPAYARAALADSVKVASDEGTVSGVEAFFRSQIGLRSTEPREGDDPDAVLSRAEAAIKTGDVDTALSELQALPEVGQEKLADWYAMVETRRAALDAAAAIAADLNNS